MAEENIVVEPKRGRGRPKKEVTLIENESAKTITMSQASKQVGEVKESSQQKITINNVQARWNQIFSKYSSRISFDTISESFGNNISALNNPFIQNARIKKINTPIKQYSKEDLKKVLEDPENSERDLRAISLYLYYTNYIYQTLIRLNRETPMYKYCYNPLYVDPTKDKESIKTDGELVDKIMRTLNPALTFKTIATQVYAEGKCSYLVRTSYDKNNVDFVLLQKLNSDNVKITGFGSKQKFTTMFDMTIFLEAGYSTKQYPKYIQDAWAEMEKDGIILRDKKGKARLNPKVQLPVGHILESRPDGRYCYWIPLPQSLCWTFYSDGISPDTFPDALGLFEDFNDLENYRWLQGNLLSKGVNSILTAEVPLVRDPKAGSDATVISPDSILGFTDLFNNLVSGNVTGFFAPFTNYKLHSIDSQPQAMDIIFDRVRDLIATSGNAALLPITDKPSIASVKAAQAIQASKSDYLTRQFEAFINDLVNENFNLKNKWHISLYGDIFNWRDDLKNLKELMIEGVEGAIPKLLGYVDLTLEDYKGSQAYLKSLGIEVKSNATKIAEKTADNNLLLKKEKTTGNPVGRPKKDPSDIDNDNTGTSSDMGNNVSDIK